MRTDKSRKRFVFLCVAPATILFFLFMILPTLNVFRMSLYERGAYSPNETFVGLKNFQHLLRDAQFIRSMQNMILLVEDQRPELFPHHLLHPQHPVGGRHLRHLLCHL